MRRNSIFGCWCRWAPERTIRWKRSADDYGLTRLARLPPEVEGLLDPQRFNLILHPKSRGSAREWGLENFTAADRPVAAGTVQNFCQRDGGGGSAAGAFAGQSSGSDRPDGAADPRTIDDLYFQSRWARRCKHGSASSCGGAGYPCAGHLSADPADAPGPLGAGGPERAGICKRRIL